MAETTQTQPPGRFKPGWAWVSVLLVPLILALLDTVEVMPMMRFALTALGHTAPFILFAILAVAFLKSTGAENLLARAFEGRETRMIVVAAFAGGLSRFCSCEVIPLLQRC